MAVADKRQRQLEKLLRIAEDRVAEQSAGSNNAWLSSVIRGAGPGAAAGGLQSGWAMIEIMKFKIIITKKKRLDRHDRAKLVVYWKDVYESREQQVTIKILYRRGLIRGEGV